MLISREMRLQKYNFFYYVVHFFQKKIFAIFAILFLALLIIEIYPLHSPFVKLNL
jgi:hypothetical protein